MIAIAALFVALGLDTFAVALGLGVAGLPRERWLSVGMTFALFEGMMPLVGLVLGQHAGTALGSAGGYAAGILLLALGGWEIREALTEGETAEAEPAARVHAGFTAPGSGSILLTGLSVSLDELAVGFSLGLLHVPLAPALAYVAVQALALTFAGLWLGRRAGARLGERAELAAGIVLAVLGAALVLSEATGTGLL